MEQAIDALWPLAAAFGAGLVLGLFFFGGLWLTLRYLPHAGWAGLLMVGSFVGRLAVVLAGFYLVMDGHWERLVVCLLGFVLLRVVLVGRQPRGYMKPAFV